MSEDKLPEITEDDFIDIDVSEAEDDPEAFASARAKLEERCKSAGIKLEEKKDTPTDIFLIVQLPAGRNTHSLALTDLEDVNNLLSVPFERYTLLGNYQAICSYEDGAIEASIAPLGRVPSTRLLLTRLMGRPLSGLSEDEAENFQIKLPSEGERGEVEVSLRAPSQSLKILSDRLMRPVVSLAITSLEVSRHDEAIDLLERIADSLFFQVDLTLGLPVTLARRRRAMRRGIPRGRRTAADLQFPRHEYDKAPISLYWYARSAIGMPLLQFLAYYQVVEFYLPTYS